MGRIEKTVFISYRRANFPWALAIYQDLHHDGYDVFFDFLSIGPGDFEKTIVENIRSRAHFLILLTPSALERCGEPGDWLRREIECAMDEQRNIVPLILEGFDFGSPATVKALTGKLADLKKYNGLGVSPEYFTASMDKLKKFLAVPVEAALQPISRATRRATRKQKSAATEAPPVPEEQLTAQAWFERGYAAQVDKKLEEAARCYQEAIRQDPQLAWAYYNLGTVLGAQQQHAQAEALYREAIGLDPANALAHTGLGVSLERQNRYTEAEAVYRKAIELEPKNAASYGGLGNALSAQQRYPEAEAAYRKAIELDPTEARAYFNLGLSFTDREQYAEAEAAFRKAIELDPSKPFAYGNLGDTLTWQARYTEAEAAYRKAIELAPSYEPAYQSLARLLRRSNRLEAAVELLETMIRKCPKSFEAYMAAASMNRQLGRSIPPEYLERAREYVPENDWLSRACLESIAGNNDLAFEHLARAAVQYGADRAWMWREPDLQWLRDDPRFAQIIGEKPAEGSAGKEQP